MSRTLKDRPPSVRFPDDGTKKPRDIDTEWRWLRYTPSWWTNVFMTRPLRREAKLWEREVQKIDSLEELEEIDKPNVSKKPHVYYW